MPYWKQAKGLAARPRQWKGSPGDHGREQWAGSCEGYWGCHGLSMHSRPRPGLFVEALTAAHRLQRFSSRLIEWFDDF